MTLEDLLEEIVGEIEDETDMARTAGYERVDRDTIVTNGDIEIDVVNKVFETNVPEGDNYATLERTLARKAAGHSKAG